uniref:Uncharacterized protein LOC114345792 isoform X1 n=1 Tax=Diabrotica virgifera virgifera TaxID=50390 RepID=A0A6P7H8Z1_DIAVI
MQLHQDLKAKIKNNVLSTWQTHWNMQNTKLRTIQRTVTSITMPQMSRKDSTIIRRLRIGHTRLTHGYLMSSENRPRCEHCDEPLTVQHILLECVQYRVHYNFQNNLSVLPGSTNMYSAIMCFLKDCHLYYLV